MGENVPKIEKKLFRVYRVFMQDQSADRKQHYLLGLNKLHIYLQYNTHPNLCAQNIVWFATQQDNAHFSDTCGTVCKVLNLGLFSLQVLEKITI